MGTHFKIHRSPFQVPESGLANTTYNYAQNFYKHVLHRTV